MEASRSQKTDDLELHAIKADVYETWAVMNRAFEQIITALGKLEKTGALKWITSTTKVLWQTTCGPESTPKSWPMWAGEKRTTAAIMGK